MNKIVKLVLFTVGLQCFVLTFCSAAPTAEEQLAKAEQLYEKGDYAEAASIMDALQQQGYHSKGLYYNLGNAYFQQEAWAKAILHYERALLVSPGDKEIQQNLALAKDRAGVDIEQIPSFFLTSFWQQLRNVASANVWAIWGLLMVWGGVAGLYLWQTAPERTRRKQGFFIGLTVLLLALLPLSLAFSRKAWQQDSQQAVVMNVSEELWSAPDQRSNSMGVAQQGLTVRLLDQIGDWYKVRLINGDEGWLPVAALEKI